jgi:uncharacterized protein
MLNLLRFHHDRGRERPSGSRCYVRLARVFARLQASKSDMISRNALRRVGQSQEKRSDAGVEAVADVCAREDLSILVNNAGVSHYMAFTDLPAGKASELLHLKVVAPTMLARAAAPGMAARGEGTIINVAGMLAFGAQAPLGNASGRAAYAGTLAHIVALSQALHEELNSQGLRIQALCPGIVATEFHERQGIDLSALPRMSAEDVVTASLRGLMLGEVVCAPGVERRDLLDAALESALAAFSAQSPHLAGRYRS